MLENKKLAHQHLQESRLWRQRLLCRSLAYRSSLHQACRDEGKCRRCPTVQSYSRYKICFSVTVRQILISRAVADYTKLLGASSDPMIRLLSSSLHNVDVTQRATTITIQQRSSLLSQATAVKTVAPSMVQVLDSSSLTSAISP